MIIAGTHLYDNCALCGKLVRLNKPILGSMHVCLSPEERDLISARRKQEAFQNQMQASLSERDTKREMNPLSPQKPRDPLEQLQPVAQPPNPYLPSPVEPNQIQKEK